MTHHVKQHFDRVVESLLASLRPQEHLRITLMGEISQFVRFNRAKVRQSGTVNDGQLTLTLMHQQRHAFCTLPLTGEWTEDWAQATLALEALRQEVPHLPEDPYLVLPQGNATSHAVRGGTLLAPSLLPEAILSVVSGVDFTGCYAGGSVLRAYADSAGQRHWFETTCFTLDYSLFTIEGQAVKGTFAGSDWDQAAYNATLTPAFQQLERLAQPRKTLPRGQYRTYFAPSALADLVGMLSWEGVSEGAIQRGGSALAALQRGEKQLSCLFSLSEAFSHGLVPRFNDLGEVAPLHLPIVCQGKLVNTLINSRTAQEYQKVSNGANRSESLQAPEVNTGSLPATEILTRLDRGLFVSNLHYLNWSDRSAGRITGMTRYACFWVEGGEVVAPIENLRFDHSLYSFWGDQLMALTDFQEFIPEVGTYERRSLGGVRVPGALVEDFSYTL